MIACFRKIVSRAMALPFAFAALMACLFETGVDSAQAGLKVDTQIRVGIAPSGMAFTPDGNHLYVANYGSNTLSVIDTATKQVSGPSPFYLTKIDIASETIVAPQLGVGLFKDGISTGLAFSPDSQIVYVPEDHLDVLQLDANTGELQATFVLSSERQSLFGGIQASPDGKFLWVAETTAKVVATINTLTGKVVTTPLGGARHPNSAVISPDGTYLCTANSGTPQVKG